MLRTYLYEIALWFLAVSAMPRMFYQRLIHGKYRKSLLKRFGIGFPAISKGKRKLIWIHAVSVGETKAISSLAKILKRQLHNPILVISSTTETGYAEAQHTIPFADYHVYMPLDLRWIIKPIIRRTSPDLVLLSETDFWYNFLKNCKERGASIAVVNGKISKTSLQRFQRLRTFSKVLFSQIDLCCVQSGHYRDRFVQAHMPAENIVVTGNMKFDEVYPQLTPEEMDKWKEQLGIGPEDLVLVVGSTHDPEEKILITALDKVWQQFPNLKVLIVPRHPERFNEVAGILSGKKFSFVRLSNLSSRKGGESVILVDAMGVLRKCYRLADLAFVGGSFVPKVGGHNIIEPCWYGVPVLFGPYMHSQIEMLTLVNEHKAGIQVNVEDLAKELIALLKDPERRKELGSGGLKLTEEAKGATQRTWDALRDSLLKSWK